MPMVRGAGSSSVPAMVAQKYGLKVRRFTTHSSLYRANAAYRVVTDNGAYVLKPFRNYYARVLRGYRQVELLERAGYPHMPHWLRARGGQPVVRFGSTFYYMVDWIEGEKLTATQAEMEELGRVLGRLHSATERLLTGTPGGDYTVRYLHKCMRLHRIFRNRLPLLAQRADSAGRWFRRHGKRGLALLEEAVRMLRQPEALAVLNAEPQRPAIIHGDITRPNVIRRKDQIYIIDWDRSRQGSIYRELVMVLANVTHFSLPLMKSLLRGYEEQRPLRPAERQVVAALFRFPTEVWHAARHVALSRGSRLQLFRTVEKTWAARIAAIAWLDRWAAKEEAEPLTAVVEPQAGGVPTEVHPQAVEQPPTGLPSQQLPPSEPLQPPEALPHAGLQPPPEVLPSADLPPQPAELLQSDAQLSPEAPLPSSAEQPSWPPQLPPDPRTV